MCENDWKKFEKLEKQLNELQIEARATRTKEGTTSQENAHRARRILHTAKDTF